MKIFYFYLVLSIYFCFPFSISYAALPFQFLLQFLSLCCVLSQAFIKCSRNTFVHTHMYYIYIYIYSMCNIIYIFEKTYQCLHG